MVLFSVPPSARPTPRSARRTGAALLSATGVSGADAGVEGRRCGAGVRGHAEPVPSRTVPVDVTSDGSAQAGEDYSARRGTVTFEARESKTVEEAVLDEGRETLTPSTRRGGWRTARRRRVPATICRRSPHQ